MDTKSSSPFEQQVGKVEYTYGWYLASVGKIWYAYHNNKDKAIIRLNVEKHLYLTLKLLAPIYYVKVAD
jgi:hypothetical protein